MNAFISNSLQTLVAQPERAEGINQPYRMVGGPSLAMADDASLIGLLTLGQVDALSELYDRYGRMVYSIALNSIGDAAVAEEVVQDVFLRVWEKAGTYDVGIAKVSTWLTSIARHRAIDEFRRGMRRPEKTSVSWTELSSSDSLYGPGPEEEIELSMQNKFVREALNTLAPEERKALALAYFMGYSQSEIAQRLSLPLGTVKTRIRNAMQKLRLVLAQSLLDDE
jgi:RNA polymerase sigma-70 factor (ECF subfamily)